MYKTYLNVIYFLILFNNFAIFYIIHLLKLTYDWLMKDAYYAE